MDAVREVRENGAVKVPSIIEAEVPGCSRERAADCRNCRSGSP